MAETFSYSSEVETQMRVVYRSLQEHDRRVYAAVEANKFGHGGTRYICEVLGCDPKTLRQGQKDLQQLRQLPDQDIVPRERVRKKGAAANRK